ncbi:hypothetical protein [Mucilaginibacter sp.]
MSNAEPNNEKQYTFTVNYSERELTCHVIKKGNQVSLHMDNNMNAELELQPDGNLKQLSGDEIPASNLQFIAKHIIEQDK